ncbi:hypothetical protein F8M41_025130 [Gigaspora margarita]|uniref:Uncharacterized protein n=1 Tax=Gigaspora margarita TaxID=4874 RepID=A0A8H3XJ34_GIGMA|nr:hypothetical protein F8M41_025130 [Gigaspora margarita]
MEGKISRNEKRLKERNMRIGLKAETEMRKNAIRYNKTSQQTSQVPKKIDRVATDNRKGKETEMDHIGEKRKKEEMNTCFTRKVEMLCGKYIEKLKTLLVQEIILQLKQEVNPL